MELWSWKRFAEKIDGIGLKLQHVRAHCESLDNDHWNAPGRKEECQSGTRERSERLALCYYRVYNTCSAEDEAWWSSGEGECSESKKQRGDGAKGPRALKQG